MNVFFLFYLAVHDQNENISQINKYLVIKIALLGDPLFEFHISMSKWHHYIYSFPAYISGHHKDHIVSDDKTNLGPEIPSYSMPEQNIKKYLEVKKMTLKNFETQKYSEKMQFPTVHQEHVDLI